MKRALLGSGPECVAWLLPGTNVHDRDYHRVRAGVARQWNPLTRPIAIRLNNGAWGYIEKAAGQVEGDTVKTVFLVAGDYQICLWRQSRLCPCTQAGDEQRATAVCTTSMTVVQLPMEGAMKTHSLHEARAGFSKLFEMALSGQPQRVTRYGKESVVLVSETDWLRRPKLNPSLGSLLAQHARSPGFTATDFQRPFSQKRQLGSNFD